MSNSTALVGVGLRHEHYYDALDNIAPIDFVEVHAENFLMPGGIVKDLLKQAQSHYKISIHATSLGLGSIDPPAPDVVDALANLCDDLHPILVSDHACFNRALVHGKLIHTGDLLPLRYNTSSLEILARHVDSVQQRLGRTLLIENLSAYLPQSEDSLSEFEFLAMLSEKTGCQLLLDLNNILVNQYNDSVMQATTYSGANIDRALETISPLNSNMVGEIHLAGTTLPSAGELMIDDHANSVSEACWQLYERVNSLIGPKPTLVEWDQQLPSWQELTALAMRAKQIQQGMPA